MSKSQIEIDLLNDLLAIGPKDRPGEKLIEKWGDLATLVSNLESSGLTERQQKVLRAAVSFHFVREEKPSFNSPASAAAVLRDLETEVQEHLVVLVLDRRNKLIRRINLYKGSVNSSQVRVGEVFRDAIILSGSAIIVAHNHPSGDPTPSPDDVAVTRAIREAGKILDIEVLDHVIIGHSGKWSSLKERGLGFA